MAKQTVVTLVDDIDGTEAEETLAFGIDGKDYEIDLSTPNATRLRDSLGPFIDAARRPSARSPRGRTNSPAARPVIDREQNRAIREWATKEGMKINERGRIPTEVLEKYHAAH